MEWLVLVAYERKRWLKILNFHLKTKMGKEKALW